MCRKGDPVAVPSHTFPGRELGKVIPYGVYGLTRNSGWGSSGIDHDTAVFAVESLCRWWKEYGQHDHRPPPGC